MKKKLIILGIVLIVGGFSFIVYGRVQEEKQFKQETKKIIEEEYEKFQVSIKTYEEAREIFYEGFLYPYIDTLRKQHNKLEDLTLSYEKSILDFVEDSKYLKEKSIKFQTDDSQINDKLKAFKVNYNGALEYYLEDMEEANQKIKIYNETLQSEESNLKELPLLETEIEKEKF